MPGVAPLALSEGNERESLSIVAAGSLCAGSRDLPRGVGRQYNVIQLDSDLSGARVHLRETTVPGTNFFQRGRMPGRGSSSYVDLRWRPPDRQTMNLDPRTRTVIDELNTFSKPVITVRSSSCCENGPFRPMGV